MITKKELALDKTAIARAIRAPLETFYEAVNAGSYDGNTVRPGNWEENEDLAKALSKSKYLAKHLDWLYALQLVYAVLDHHPKLTPTKFVDELEDLIVATAGERDYLAVFPLGFKPEWSFGLPGMQRTVVKRKAIANFSIAPALPTGKAFNRLVSKQGFPPISESSFQHAMRTSNGSFSRQLVVTFNIHGAEDQLRWNADFEFTRFRRLVEVFGCLFGGNSSGLAPGVAANHFFLLNKTTGELRRFPTRAPSFVDLALDEPLLKVIGSPTFADFLSQLSSSSDGRSWGWSKAASPKSFGLWLRSSTKRKTSRPGFHWRGSGTHGFPLKIKTSTKSLLQAYLQRIFNGTGDDLVQWDQSWRPQVARASGAFLNT